MVVKREHEEMRWQRYNSVRILSILVILGIVSVIAGVFFNPKGEKGWLHVLLVMGDAFAFLFGATLGITTLIGKLLLVILTY